MAIRLGINGFGRIGRNVFRILHNNKKFEVAGINDLGSAEAMAFLLKYDSVYGPFPGRVEHREGCLVVEGKEIRLFNEKDPSKLPWKELKVDFAVESTGKFRKRSEISLHLDAGAEKVVLTVPAKDEIDATIVMGVNQHTLKAGHRIISNASCTTNCLAPMAKVLNDRFGIEQGLMTTIHAYTNDQVVLDVPHKDLRRGRASALNMIPTTTGAAAAVGKVIPELNGKLNGMAVRVPLPDGSLVDFVGTLAQDATKEEINQAMKEGAEGNLRGILEYTEDPIVSVDVIKNPHSCVFDSLSTMVLGNRMIKVLGWYDNEWGYSNRVVDLIEFAMGI